MQEAAGTGRGVLGPLAALLLSSLCSCAGLAPAVGPSGPGFEERGIVYSLILRSSPRPLRVHLVVADLDSGGLALCAPVPRPAPQPGGWEARLEAPLREARRLGSLVLVNASAFSVPGFGAGRRPLEYLPGMRADIAGLAIHGGRLYSPSRRGFAAVRVDAQGGISADGSPSPGQPDAGWLEAAAGFAMLVQDGVDRSRAGGVLAARTSIGRDGAGRLILMVVEGGQRGRSEGVSLSELSALMLEQGAVWALNMDGGGSSVMVLGCGGEERVVSRGEERLLGLGLPPRPVPNFLALLPLPPPAAPQCPADALR